MNNLRWLILLLLLVYPVLRGKAQNSSKSSDSIPLPTKAYFVLTTNRQEVFVGECFMLTLSLQIEDSNKIPLRFWELGRQLPEMIAKFPIDDCLLSKSPIIDIAGQKKGSTTLYEIYKAACCPLKEGNMEFPQLVLEMQRRNLKNEFDIAKFRSRPFSVKVKERPSGKPSTFDNYPLTGKLRLTETFRDREAQTNFPISYKVTIEGEGLTYPVTAPVIDLHDALVELDYIVDHDTIADDKYLSSKSFYYTIYFRKPRKEDLRNKITLIYFNPETQHSDTLYSRSSILVLPANFPDPVPSSPFYARENLILIDGSQSMLLEDYTPNRLRAMTGGLDLFLSKRVSCDVGLIQFAGYPQFIDVTAKDACYSSEKIKTITWMTSEKSRGTAIGEAILFARNYIKGSRKVRKIVLIGDGDNTTGFIKASDAAHLAKNQNIQIFTIGIGLTGLVPYGKDPLGRPQMVDNTFSDKTLKQVAEITGGKYFWAKDAEAVAQILQEIFSH